MYNFKTKAQTLEFLSKHEADINAKILPLYYFTLAQWKEDPSHIWRTVSEKFAGNNSIIVRSSAQNEDTAQGSQAGKFTSEICSFNQDDFVKTVDNVFASYDSDDVDNQALVQPVLEKVEGAGVAFTVDPNSGGNYYVVNYDMSGSTSTITSGQGKSNKLYYQFKGSNNLSNANENKNYLNKLCITLGHLEALFETNRLDVEFAFRDGDIFIFQVRPLCLNQDIIDIKLQGSCIRRIKKFILEANKPKPFLYGQNTLYSNMTDWNPAEMIGVHPKNLALSLYKELITDNIWAYQRDNYGYKKLRSFPLMVDFCGMPYIDVRVSFNSFIPADLSPEISEKLVNYYLSELVKRPQDHDKVEFDIIFSCYTFDLPKRIEILREHGFSSEEMDTITQALRKLTIRIINSKTGLWRNDNDKIKILEHRFYEVLNSELDDIGKMYWLIEDCKRYGTLPFAGLARAGFIAVQILQSMIKEEIINQKEYNAFMADITTVGSQMKWDFNHLAKETFLKKYGHLRPGTYDITSDRYDEKPDFYFRWPESNSIEETDQEDHFRLSIPQIRHIRNALEKHALGDDVLGLFTFIKAAIEGREMAKFIFTKNLSETLRLFGSYCEKHGIARKDSAFSDVRIIKEIYGTTTDENDLLIQSIQKGKQKYEESGHLVLPPLITRARDVERFFIPDSQPTFITQKSAKGPVVMVTRRVEENLQDSILLIPSADPGFDWIFSYEIAGFITEYGGANSHMAIRAGELNLPAIIGAGQKFFNQVAAAEFVEIDAAQKRVNILR